MPVFGFTPGDNPVAEGYLFFGTQDNPEMVKIYSDGRLELNGTDYTFGPYTAPDSFGSNVSDAGAGFPPVGSYSEPGDRVRLQGRVTWTGALGAGSEIITLAEDHRPLQTITHPGVRTGPTGNISTVLTIAPTGVVSLVAAGGTAGYLGLDTITFKRDGSS